MTATILKTRNNSKRPWLLRIFLVLLVLGLSYTEILHSQELFSYNFSVHELHTFQSILDSVSHPNRPSEAWQSKLTDCPTLALSWHKTDPNRGNPPIMVPIQSESPHSFFVSLHPKEFDNVRWDIYRRHRYYETKLEHAWSQVLQQAVANDDGHIRILDVGGNIGYFSLYSTAFDQSVVVDMFEPNPLNLLRACEALQRNGLASEFDADGDDKPPHKSAINLWQWGVSDTTGTLPFAQNKNPGAGRFVTQDQAVDTDDHRRVVGDPQPVPVTTLDDFARTRGWLTRNGGSDRSRPSNNDSMPGKKNPRIEILKIDVEKHEANVILGATALLQSHMIKNIFVEFARDSDRTLQKQALQTMIDAGYTLCGWGRFQGPVHGSVPFDVQDRDNFVANFYKHFLQMRGITVNLWWQVDSRCPVGSSNQMR